MLEAWVGGEVKPTLKQLERFAKATHTPVGFLFLPEPPVERVPIADMRTMGGEGVGRHGQIGRIGLIGRGGRPSPELLETIYLCQQRQEWYRDFARSVGEERRGFVGSVALGSDVVRTAAGMRRALGFDLGERARCGTWDVALRRFVEQADALGVLVMVNGVVGSNTRRKLDPREFRGFALVDDLAPLVFVNGADTKSAQMFTLAHELAHLWLGESALSDASLVRDPAHEVERWCDRVAVELLVPLAVVVREYDAAVELGDEVARLARRFKVSTLVMLRRIHDAGGLTPEQLWEAYRLELERLLALGKSSGGGDFYSTEAVRVGKRFARALVVSTLEGHTLHRDAFRLLGLKKLRTFRELGQRLGVGVGVG
jgi:Zn-dependent peptidase ImmA (M78 family)